MARRGGGVRVGLGQLGCGGVVQLTSSTMKWCTTRELGAGFLRAKFCMFFTTVSRCARQPHDEINRRLSSLS